MAEKGVITIIQEFGYEITYFYLNGEWLTGTETGYYEPLIEALGYEPKWIDIHDKEMSEKWRRFKDDWELDDLWPPKNIDEFIADADQYIVDQKKRRLQKTIDACTQELRKLEGR